MSYIITRINIVLVKFNNRYNNARRAEGGGGLGTS